MAIVNKVIAEINQEQMDVLDVLSAASESPIQETNPETERLAISEAPVTQEQNEPVPATTRIEDRVQQLNANEDPPGFDYDVSRQSEFEEAAGALADTAAGAFADNAAGALADNAPAKSTPASLFDQVLEASNNCNSPARSSEATSVVSVHKHDTRFAKAHKLPLPSPFIKATKVSEE